MKRTIPQSVKLLVVISSLMVIAFQLLDVPAYLRALVFMSTTLALIAYSESKMTETLLIASLLIATLRVSVLLYLGGDKFKILYYFPESFIFCYLWFIIIMSFKDT